MNWMKIHNLIHFIAPSVSPVRALCHRPWFHRRSPSVALEEPGAVPHDLNIVKYYRDFSRFSEECQVMT